MNVPAGAIRGAGPTFRRRPAGKVFSSPAVETIGIGYRQNYAPAGSRYGLWTGMWGVDGLTHGVDFDAGASYADSFPDRTRIYGFVPAPGDGGVYGYPQIWWGNYDGGVVDVPVTPVQVRDLSVFDVEVDFTASGAGVETVLDEFYLCATEGDAASKSHEIGWMRRTSAHTADWVVASGTLVGTYVDEDDGSWDVYRVIGGASGIYIVFHPSGEVLEQRTGSDRLRALRWLALNDQIDTSHWINGTAVGVEPLSGAFDVTFGNFSAAMSGGGLPYATDFGGVAGWTTSGTGVAITGGRLAFTGASEWASAERTLPGLVPGIYRVTAKLDASPTPAGDWRVLLGDAASSYRGPSPTGPRAVDLTVAAGDKLIVQSVGAGSPRTYAFDSLIVERLG